VSTPEPGVNDLSPVVTPGVEKEPVAIATDLITLLG